MTNTDDFTVVRVTIEHSDGSIIELAGEGATAWDNAMSSQAAVAFVHGCAMPKLPWRVVKAARE